ASKEFQTYFEDVHEDVNKGNIEIEEATGEFVSAIVAHEPERAIEILNDKVIPKNESILEKLNSAEVTEESLVSYNDMSTDVAQLRFDKNVHLRDLLEKIMGSKESENEAELDLDAELAELF